MLVCMYIPESVSLYLFWNHVSITTTDDRQMKYVLPIAEDKFKPSSETAFSLGVSLLLHQQTRKKSLVDIASRLGIGEGYSRVLRLEAQIAHATKRLNECNGLYIPPFVVKTNPVFFCNRQRRLP